VAADADIAVYNVNPRRVDPSREYQTFRKAFSRAAYTIKGGEIVVKDGEIVKPVQGRTFWVDAKLTSPMKPTEDLKQKFREYWTVEYENYPVPEEYLAASVPLTIEARI
jgi:formylmethanofuran dehydrogenase subunit A